MSEEQKRILESLERVKEKICNIDNEEGRFAMDQILGLYESILVSYGVPEELSESCMDAVRGLLEDENVRCISVVELLIQQLKLFFLSMGKEAMLQNDIQYRWQNCLKYCHISFLRNMITVYM